MTIKSTSTKVSDAPDWFSKLVQDSEEWYGPGEWQVNSDKLYASLRDKLIPTKPELVCSSITPLEPMIRLDHSTSRTTCITCGVEDRSILCLYFSWSEPGNMRAGGTSVALCLSCRMRTISAISGYSISEEFDRDRKHDRGHPRTESELSDIPHPSKFPSIK